jgi:hypothetical protein
MQVRFSSPRCVSRWPPCVWFQYSSQFRSPLLPRRERWPEVAILGLASWQQLPERRAPLEAAGMALAMLACKPRWNAPSGR